MKTTYFTFENVNHQIFSSIISVAPTALWISKKEQHLLAGTEATYPCFSVGAYPQNRFTWYLDNTPIQKTPSNVIVNKVILLVEKFVILI